jgi:hypothetical protein
MRNDDKLLKSLKKGFREKKIVEKGIKEEQTFFRSKIFDMSLLPSFWGEDNPN